MKGLFRLTIGTKIIGLIAILLVCSITGLIYISSDMFIQDNTSLIQQMNSDTASNIASQVRETLDGLTEKMRIVGAVVREEFANPESKKQVMQEFYTKDKDFLGVFVHEITAGNPPVVKYKSVSPVMTEIGDESGDTTISAITSGNDFSIQQIQKGDIQISTFKLVNGKPALALGVPFSKKDNETEFSQILTTVVKLDKFTKSFTDSEIVTSFMVDKKGRLLAHTDSSQNGSGDNLSALDIVKKFLEGKANNGQIRYQDPASQAFKLAAYRVVGFGGLGVIAEVPEAKAFEAAKRVQYRATLVGLAILFIAFLFGYLYSGTLTRPIKQLVEAAQRISAGDFNIHLKPKSHDEIAHLSNTFNEMAKGLEERDRVKETFNKFHNKEIADKLLSGEVKLGGERKEATVFFSDVRGFTGMSEQMEPEEVVEMLNEYMTRMVAIIRTYRGVVDKYVGDAIMALWGVPLGNEDDTYNAVAACLAIRQELADLNELRMSRGQPPLKIGMGLNTGQVIAGNIGSDEKMEYTVIGDSVNLASRVESMTKEYGTDLLISSAVYEKVKGRFVFEQVKSARVKGKAEAIILYRVLGFIDEQGQQVLVETPYSSYASEKSDKAVHEEKPAEGHGGGDQAA
jgi:adenylate cyclase